MLSQRRPRTHESYQTPRNTEGVRVSVVFLVALRLCMVISIASGVPAGAGLIGGIVAGLVVGWLAGCLLQVNGPAAGLTVIVSGSSGLRVRIAYSQIVQQRKRQPLEAVIVTNPTQTTIAERGSGAEETPPLLASNACRLSRQTV